MSELPRVLDSSNEPLAPGSHRQQRQPFISWRTFQEKRGHHRVYLQDALPNNNSIKLKWA